MLATAVALNLEGATEQEQVNGASNPLVGAVMDGGDPRHLLSASMGAMLSDANGVPFNGSWCVGTGNLAADMHSNVTAEGGGRVLATRLWEMTDDPGMKDMLSFLIARDTMHQNQWMAVLEELKDMGMPAPQDFPQSEEVQDHSYEFFVHSDGEIPDDARWTSGPSVDSHGQFSVRQAEPMGGIPDLAPPEAAPEMHNTIVQAEGGFLRKAKDGAQPTIERTDRPVKSGNASPTGRGHHDRGGRQHLEISRVAVGLVRKTRRTNGTTNLVKRRDPGGTPRGRRTARPCPGSQGMVPQG